MIIRELIGPGLIKSQGNCCLISPERHLYLKEHFFKLFICCLLIRSFGAVLGKQGSVNLKKESKSIKYWKKIRTS